MASSDETYLSEERQEFRVEALDLLDLAEHHLLAIDRGEAFQKNYDAIFRTFHNIKGTAGTLGWEGAQTHMHELESLLMDCKRRDAINQDEINHLLIGIDICRVILNGGDVDAAKTKAVELQAKSEPATSQNTINVPIQTAPVEAKPSQTSTSVESSPAPVPVPGAPELKKSFTAFVIDDEPDIVDVIERILLDAGFEVRGFTSAQPAIDAAKISLPDVVVTDMKMPGLTGRDVLKQMNAIDPDLPVIFVSGHLTLQSVVEAVAIGVAGIIEKPFSEVQIVSVCTAAAQRHAMSQLLNRTINFLMFQFADLDQYLKEKQMPELRDKMHAELKTILDTRRKLKLMKMNLG